MSDIGIRLVQLPNGDWIDPRQILGVCADAVVHKQTGEVGPAVIVVSTGGREIYWRVASEEDAKRQRDETVRLLWAVTASEVDSAKAQKRLGPLTLADELEGLAERPYLIDCACHEVETSLVDMRDDGTHVWCANYGLVIKDREGGDSCIIRMYFDEALRISLRRIAHQIRMQAKAGNSQENNHGNSGK